MERIPADRIPAERTPVERTPVENIRVGNIRVEKIPAENIPVAKILPPMREKPERLPMDLSLKKASSIRILWVQSTQRRRACSS